MNKAFSLGGHLAAYVMMCNTAAQTSQTIAAGATCTISLDLPLIPDSDASITTLDGILMLTGSVRFGDQHRPVAGANSLSDLDLLWVSDYTSTPPAELVCELTERAEYSLVWRPKHVALKHFAPRTIEQWPAWITNTWLSS